MNKKMTTCKACGKEIAKSAKRCPSCGAKNKKPFFKKWWFWLIIVILLISVSSGGEDSTADMQDPETSPQTSSQTGSKATTPTQTEFYVGDMLMDGKTRIVYMSSGEYIEKNEFSQPQAGNKYIYLQFAFENTSDTADDSVSIYNFEGYADGYSVSMYYGGAEDLSATLSAGRTTTGFVYFEVPANAEKVEIEYTLNMFTEEKATFIYEGEKDSGYVPVINTAATPDAYHVGNTVTSSQLTISYLSCSDYISTNDFIQPKNGNKFIVCEFEFENVGSGDQYISSYDFDCYADGANCEQVFMLENDLSATLSAGRKARGTVMFEVPTNAQVIEVEYLSNYWTSNRVVFAAE